MGFRIDPIDSNGVFDHDFYTSQEYTAEVAILNAYLEAEGFEIKQEAFSIMIKGRTWLVKPHNTPPKKK
jgi:hypothetical protein